MATNNAFDPTPIYQAAAQEWNLDPSLLQAVARQESGGTANPDQALSTAGAQGRMQLMPGTAKQMGVTDPSDPVQNIYGGAKYLSQMLDKYHKPELALAAYNAGPGRIDAYLAGQGPLPAETAAYVPSVTKHYQALTASQQAAPSVANPSNLDQAISALRNAPVASANAPSADDPFSQALQPAAASSQPANDPFSQTLTAGQPDPFSAALSDAQKATALAVDAGPKAGTGILGALENFAEGAGHGVQQVSRALYAGLDAADRAVPSLSGLNNNLINPKAALANLDAQDKTFQGSGVGDTWEGQAGGLVGQTVATLPAMGPLGRAMAAGGSALAGVAPGAANALAGVAGANMLTRGATALGKASMIGAGYGGAQAAMTGSDPLSGVELGAALGPVAPVVALGGRLAGIVGRGAVSAGASVANKLTGSTASLDRDIDAAIVRARGAAEPGVAPAASSAAPPQPAASAPVTTAPVVPVTSTPLSPPVPNSAGAAATSASDLTANAMTPAQAAASRATGFADRLSQTAARRFDNTEYVQGSTPTLAEQTADPALLAQQRVVMPGNSAFTDLDTANNEARLTHFDRIAGSPTTLETLEAQRSAQADTDLSAAWANKKPADAQPVMDQINAALAGPDGKLAPVRSALTEAASALTTHGGDALETDPEMLYGARKQISYLMSKTGQRANPAYGEPTVIRQLQGVKDALDAAIEPSAPGYQKYLDNYSAASKPIDVQDLLQSKRAGLLGMDGTMQLSRVHSMMKSIGDQMSLPGPNAAKSLSDDDLDGLFNLRSDLLRQNNRTLGRAMGSDTQANQTVAGEIGMNALSAGAHVLASHVPGANMLVGPALSSALRSSNAKVRDRLTNRLLSAEPMVSLNALP